MPLGHILKSIFRKILLGIEKAVKTFSIPDKTLFKNSILLCALMAHVSKILNINNKKK